MSKWRIALGLLVGGLAVVGVVLLAFWAWIREKVIEFMQEHQIERLENLFLTIDGGASTVRRIFTLAISTVAQPSSLNISMLFDDDNVQSIEMARQELSPEELPPDVLEQFQKIESRKEFDISVLIPALTH